MDASDSNHPNERLRQERIRCNWRQRDLAYYLETTVVTINRWERGTQRPGPYFRLKLCALFGKSAEELGFFSKSSPNKVEIKPVESVENLITSFSSTSPHMWGIPYLRNPFFIGREDILHQLHDTLNGGYPTALNRSYTLSGMGGIGKTQIAIEYVYRFADNYVGVFWINAETTENIVSSLATIADILNLPKQQDQAEVVAVVTRWLINHSGWLLIFDNVEDPVAVKHFLPPTPNGSLLFTSRRKLLGLTAKTIDLKLMTPEEGMHFLLHRTKRINLTTPLDEFAPTDAYLAREIAIAMGGLPLALDQAGIYIETNQINLAEYFRLFQFFPYSLLNEADHPQSVIRTFALAFEQLKQNNALAAELLTVCAFLAPEAIPETFFLEGGSYLGSAFEVLIQDPFKFYAAIKTLLSCSLLQRNNVTNTLTIHCIIQIVLKGYLPEAIQRSYAIRVIYAMIQLFPSGKEVQINYWQNCKQLLPHALACVTLVEQWCEDETLRLTLMKHVESYLVNNAHFSRSRMSERS